MDKEKLKAETAEIILFMNSLTNNQLMTLVVVMISAIAEDEGITVTGVLEYFKGKL